MLQMPHFGCVLSAGGKLQTEKGTPKKCDAREEPSEPSAMGHRNSDWSLLFAHHVFLPFGIVIYILCAVYWKCVTCSLTSQ